MRRLAFAVLLIVPLSSQARPFRAMVTRTAETTNPWNFELGLRYQGFFAGRGLGALPYDQLSPGLRLGLLKGIELDAGVDFLLIDLPGTPNFRALLGDVPIGLQATFLETRHFAMGIYLEGRIPLGPGYIDVIPPSLSDGTYDATGLFVAELRPTRSIRLMANLGYEYHGVRIRSPLPDFDVPDALRYDVALTANLGERVLLGVELDGHYYLRPGITPRWTDNANQAEIIPHARFELVPNFVLEAALGFALTPDLQDIYLVRGLLGFTYEFDL
jgi:hypothetical protein